MEKSLIYRNRFELEYEDSCSVKKETAFTNKAIKLLVLLLPFLLILPDLQAREHQEAVSMHLSPTGHEARGNHWLYVIGINEYTDWPRMGSAVNDAKAVRDVLLRRYGFDKYHLIELYDKDATRRNIIDKLRFLSRRVGPDDSIVIFYAGHGYMDSITKEGNWIPVESEIEETSAWVTTYDIRGYLKISSIKAKHILLISCASFSGDFFKSLKEKLPEVTDTVIRKAYKLASRQAITSGELMSVRDKGFGENSIFTYFLVKALEENRKPFLIPSDFFPIIKAGVMENNRPLPEFWLLDGVGGQPGGEMVFFLQQHGGVDEKEKAGTANAHPGRDSHARTLDEMLAMVKDKAHQKKQLEGLKREKEVGERNRIAEIERLKRAQAAIKEDMRKYEKIISSEYGGEMSEAAWNNLISRYPEARGLSVGDIKGLKRRIYPKMNLRSSYRKMTVPQAQSIHHISIRENADWGFYGYSTIQNDYELKTINNDKVVVDHATGLMWFQSGSVKYLNHEKSIQLLKKINNKSYAGYNDWRLPTLEEAASLLEPDKKNSLFVDAIFDREQSSIWTGDNYNPVVAWRIAFDSGSVSWGN